MKKLIFIEIILSVIITQNLFCARRFDAAVKLAEQQAEQEELSERLRQLHAQARQYEADLATKDAAKQIKSASDYKVFRPGKIAADYFADWPRGVPQMVDEYVGEHGDPERQIEADINLAINLPTIAKETVGEYAKMTKEEKEEEIKNANNKYTEAIERLDEIKEGISLDSTQILFGNKTIRNLLDQAESALKDGANMNHQYYNARLVKLKFLDYELFRNEYPKLYKLFKKQQQLRKYFAMRKTLLPNP